MEDLIEPMPVGNDQRVSGMHWLETYQFGSADAPTLVALQWNPGSRTWTHSGYHDTFNGKKDVRGYRYVAKIEMPPITT